jgi:hypothetical protein
MEEVLKLVETSGQETIDALLFLQHEAEKGPLNLMAVFARPGEEEDAILAGAYKVRPELAVFASLKLTKKLLKGKK